MNEYHRRFLSSFTCESVVGLFTRYRGGPKEITESWAMLEAAKAHVPFSLQDAVVVVIGDGASPRTGALFAYFTKAEVYSIDPQMNMDHWHEHCDKQEAMGFPVARLAACPIKAEAFELCCAGKNLLVVWPHSHADMLSLKGVTGYRQRVDIAMPCCVPPPKELMRVPHISYVDYNVESPQRTIHIWKEQS